MRRSRLFIVVAGSLVAVGPTQATAQQVCKPALALKDARTSDARNLQRTWRAVLAVDASPCSTRSGPFEIQFTRLKEQTPDLRFVERFTWAAGQTEISLDIWWDEWLQDYRIADIAPCPCRN